MNLLLFVFRIFSIFVHILDVDSLLSGNDECTCVVRVFSLMKTSGFIRDSSGFDRGFACVCLCVFSFSQRFNWSEID